MRVGVNMYRYCSSGMSAGCSCGGMSRCVWGWGCAARWSAECERSVVMFFFNSASCDIRELMTVDLHTQKGHTKRRK